MAPDLEEATRYERRGALKLLGGAGLGLLLAACGSDGKSASSANAAADGTTSSTVAKTTTTTAAPTTTTTAAATTKTTAASTKTTTAPTATTAAPASTGTVTVAGKIPSETAGPFPADGTNGPNVLTQAGVIRSDIRPGFGSSSGTAAGVPLTIELTIADAATKKVLPGYAVYLWHCDINGSYSLYASGLTGQNYLRGVQVAGANGIIRFTSIFPAAYSGRWPHIHFEVFNALAQATTGRNAVRTSQLALPAATCQEVYATPAYVSSAQNLSNTSLATDNVFSDGSSLQLATMSGSVANGYTARLVVGI